MKVGVIASILGKDAKEFVSSHKLAEDVETLDESILESILTSEISDLKKSVKSEAKKEGFGWAEKQVKADIEKRLKTEFGVDGETLDDLFESLKSKTGKPIDESKAVKEAALYKGKYELTNQAFEDFKKNVEVKERQSLIIGKLDSLVTDKFDLTGKEKLKKIAFSNFIQEYDFEVLDNEIHLIDKATKKPTFKNMDDVAQEYFKDIFPEKTGKPNHPNPLPHNDPTKVSAIPGTRADILMALKTEKDPTQRQLLTQKLKSLKD